MRNYYILETKGNNHIVIYDTFESLLVNIYYYYGDCEEITIKNVYKVYEFKRDDLKGVSIFVDKRAKELLASLNGKPYGRGEINITYYLFKKTDNILTGVGKKCIAPCWDIWQLIHN